MVDRVDLFAVHGALSALLHAVKTELTGLSVGVSLEYTSGTYLCVVIQVSEKRKQFVVDKLRHGVLNGDYDYRFSVSYPTSYAEPFEAVEVRAYPDMFHDQKRKRERTGA